MFIIIYKIKRLELNLKRKDYLCKMIRLTKIFTFETAHVLYGYDGKCKNLHGHSYRLFVTVKGIPLEDITHSKNGMLMDFGELKLIVNEEIVSQWDHAVLINAKTPHLQLGEQLKSQGHQVVFCDFQPTCEMMLYAIAEKINFRLPAHITLASLKLYETETSYAEWFADDQNG